MGFVFQKWHKEFDEHKENIKASEKESNSEAKGQTDTTGDKKEQSTEEKNNT